MRSGIVAALLLVFAAAADAQQAVPRAATRAADEFLAPEAAAPEELRAENPIVERIEKIRSEIASEREEMLELEKRAREATGLEEAGLRSQAFEYRIRNTRQLRELVDLVQKLEEQGGDASLYREQLTELLPALVPALRYHLDAAEKAVKSAESDRESAAPEERMAVEQRVTRQGEMLDKLLRAAVDLVEAMEEMSLDSARARQLASDRLVDRARLIAGRMDLVKQQLADARERLDAAPEDADTESTLRALDARLDADSRSLAADIALMDELGLDTAAYKQQRIRATGEITTDVFDLQVARGLLRSWIEKLGEDVASNGPRFLFHLLIFSLVLMLFWVIAGIARKLTSRAVESERMRMSQLLKRMLVSLVSGTVKVLGVLVALSQLGVQVGPVLAGLGIAGFIVGFALQDTLANFAAGIMILAYRPYDVGDIIDCAGGVFGKVGSMNLVSTTILTFDNQTKVVPNGKIWGDVITNVTAQRVRRVDLTFGISYSDDIALAEKILWSAVEGHEKVLANPEPIVKLHELGDSSVNFVVRPWVARDDYWDVYWDLTREVKIRFDREGITIPFPQRDVHFHPASRAESAASGGARPSVASAPHERTAQSSHTDHDDDT